jgi:hypothetical protein
MRLELIHALPRIWTLFLCLEALDPEFVDAFWEFVKAAEYENKERSEGDKVFYRFWKPAQPDYPFMLELFPENPICCSSVTTAT